MQGSDFQVWLSYHSARFPGVSNMLDRDETIARDWFYHLEAFEVEETEKATLEIMALDPQPFPGDHLGKIKAICKRNRMIKNPVDPSKIRYRDTETFSCPICHDFGVIWVFHPIAYQPIKDDAYNRAKHLRELVVGCNCPAAQQFVNKDPETSGKKQFSQMLRFDDAAMLPTRNWETGLDRDETDLIEFVTERLRPRRFHSEFEAFS